MACVLCLFEGVATGAADGYARMADKPAATLLHLGPGLANGLANLHNAKRAGSPVVNIVGDHAGYHRAYDAPLTFSIEIGVRPAAELGPYKGLEVGRRDPEIEPGAVDAELEALRVRVARPQSVSRPAQSGDLLVIDFNGLIDGEPFVAASQARYARQRRIALDRLQALPGVLVPEPTGAFYVFPRLDGLADSVAFCRHLVAHHGVGLAPGAAFGAGGEGQGAEQGAGEDEAREQEQVRVGVGRDRAGDHEAGGPDRHEQHGRRDVGQQRGRHQASGTPRSSSRRPDDDGCTPMDIDTAPPAH